MSQAFHRSTERPDPDQPIADIADYVMNRSINSDEAFSTARYCLMDSMSCALLALDFPECVKLLGPVVPGATLPGGARVPGTSFALDPVKAAFDIGVLIRYLDFNDTWLAAEWGHPSDNLGAILSVADYLSRQSVSRGGQPIVLRDVLDAMIRAHEVQGVMALENSFNQVGLDHVLLVRIASTALATKMLGGSQHDVINALSNAFVDGGALRTYRHAPNTGPRKSWAAGDACRRAVQLALLALQGEMGYPSALSAKDWGFYDVLFKGNAFQFQRDFGSYVMENVLFKISFPAEFHAQTAVEAALSLHEQCVSRLDDIKKITIETQAAGARIIDKTGPLNNYADRDHCIQYMVAAPLIFGELNADSYSDAVAADPRIDTLRDKMEVSENKTFTEEYFDPDKRAIGNALQVHFNDGSSTDRVQVDYPIGHRRRREEGIPVLVRKFENATADQLPARKRDRVLQICDSQESFERTPVDEFIGLFTR